MAIFFITSSGGRRGNYKSRQTHRQSGSSKTMSDFVVNPLPEFRAWVSDYPHKNGIYSQTSNRSRTKFPNLNVFQRFLQLSLPNPLMPCVKSRMKIGAAPTGDSPAIRLSDQNCYCLPIVVLRCDSY